MSLRTRVISPVVLALLSIVVYAGAAHSQPRPITTIASGPAALRQWDGIVDQMLRTGEFEVRRADNDTLISGRVHTRLRQLHHGVPVYGAEMTRQTGPSGATVSIFGTIYQDIAIDPTPALGVDDAVDAIERLSGVRLGPDRLPTLYVLPTGDGYKLAYRARVFSLYADTEYFIDANDATVLQEMGAAERQSAIGSGTGVLNNTQKMSVNQVAGGFGANDVARPPTLVTYNMKENLQRTLDYLNGDANLGSSDLASDTDNVWTDGAAVDAHAYAGFFYDYYFKRFNRHGLDDNNFHMLSLVHPAPRASVASQPANVVNAFYANAFYAGNGVMVYGEGFPPGITYGGRQWNYMAGALDIVAHELTHGITGFTSNLLYQNESGALNESFSDMMGTAVEFYFQPPGSGPLMADYLLGEDVTIPAVRSMENPASFSQPDHYSKRITVPLSNDNGGVHTNSGISNQMYYLAIEGGTNRTSGMTVQGVAVANREQIEKAMYRGFTQLMPANATFSVARAVTIQAATDLYGSSSAAVRAITDAWAAVGVN